MEVNGREGVLTLLSSELLGFISRACLANNIVAGADKSLSGRETDEPRSAVDT